VSVFFNRVRLGPLVRRVHQPWRWVPFGIRLRVARCRAWMVRRRLLRRLIAAVVVVGLGLVVVGAVSRGRAAQRLWGNSVEVVSIDVDVAVGELVDIDDLSIVRRPAAFIPQGALDVVPANDDVAVRSLRQGDLVTQRDLRSTRPRVVLPAGTRAVSLPLDATIPHVETGDLVDLYLVDDSFGVERTDVTKRVDVPALVIEVAADAVVLAVDSDSVAAVATTQATGRIVIALR